MSFTTITQTRKSDIHGRYLVRISKSLLINIVASGIVAGSLDIAFATMFWAIKADISPIRIFQTIASGALGAESYEGGVQTALLGLVLHFTIAVIMAAAYFLLAVRLETLWRRPFIIGSAYGLVLYGFMNFIVLPLSAASSGSNNPTWIWMSVIVHMFFVGIPIALFAKRTFNPVATR